MQVIKHRPIIAPFAWSGAELQSRTDWIRPFSRGELDELDAALKHVKQRGLDWVDVAREDFALPQLAHALQAIAEELESGRGMILLRGLPLAYSANDLRLVYWGIGCHLGTALSQGGRGELLGSVEDEGTPVDFTKYRGSKTADRLPFHGDRCDVVGLLCVRKARSGGVSRIVAAAEIHNEILRRRPDLIELFYADWYHSRQGDEAPGEQRAYAKPIFGFRDAYFSGIFSPNYVRAAQKFPEVPRMSPQQQEALALFDALTDELALDMSFEPGDIQLLNNHLIYHSRTDFEDYAEPERRRLLLRLWLSVPNARPLPDGWELVFGTKESGGVRGGVPAKEGWRDVNELRTRRRGATAANRVNA